MVGASDEPQPGVLPLDEVYREWEVRGAPEHPLLGRKHVAAAVQRLHRPLDTRVVKVRVRVPDDPVAAQLAVVMKVPVGHDHVGEPVVDVVEHQVDVQVAQQYDAQLLHHLPVVGVEVDVLPRLLVPLDGVERHVARRPLPLQQVEPL